MPLDYCGPWWTPLGIAGALMRHGISRCFATQSESAGLRRCADYLSWRPTINLLLVGGLGLGLQLRQLAVEFRNRGLKRCDFGPRGGEIATGAGDLLLRLARKLRERLLKKLDIGLQAPGAALHLLFGRADFQATDVLCICPRQQREKKHPAHAGERHAREALVFKCHA